MSETDMKNTQKIEELVELCRKNDRVAQQTVFDLFKSSMFAICRRYSRSLPEAEDNLIDGFTNVFTKIQTYDERGSFENWARKIFVNACLSCYEREFKHYRTERLDETHISNTIEEISDTYSKEELYEAINSLNDKYRVIFNMIAIDGYTYEETAKEFGTNINVIKTILHRTRQQLRIYLANIDKKKRSL